MAVCEARDLRASVRRGRERVLPPPDSPISVGLPHADGFAVALAVIGDALAADAVIAAVLVRAGAVLFVLLFVLTFFCHGGILRRKPQCYDGHSQLVAGEKVIYWNGFSVSRVASWGRAKAHVFPSGRSEGVPPQGPQELSFTRRRRER